MSGGTLHKRSAKSLKGGDSDWARVDRLTDAEIEAAINDDPDVAPALDDAWFRDADIVPPAKAATSIRIDQDVLAWFRGYGRGWQTRMNAVLRAYAKGHGGVR
ncbi:MAG TPA: BrnA antitoxin family protein [Caulobacteraceae bacterium]|nr:BrnA antitoxin family protein [Caulobacteraceae bacterium]